MSDPGRPSTHVDRGSVACERDPVLKRLFDVVMSIVGLIVTAPLWPVVALAAKVQSPGKTFYRQRRWGCGGRTFEVVKFRTMTTGDGDPIEQSRRGDARITSVGRVLRRMGLDELPQLLSILRGDMSFVGPRPLAIGEVVRDDNGQIVSYEDIPGFAERLRVRPGLTGATTVHLARDASPREKFAADVEYIENRTFIGDLKLFIISILNSVSGRWDSHTPGP